MRVVGDSSAAETTRAAEARMASAEPMVLEEVTLKSREVAGVTAARGRL